MLTVLRSEKSREDQDGSNEAGRGTNRRSNEGKTDVL